MSTIKELFSLIIVTISTTVALGQNSDYEILVPGNPPLTSLMVGKTVVFLDWVLDLKLNRQQQNQIGDVIQNAWRNKDKQQMQSTLEAIEVYEQVMKLNEAERNKVKANLRQVLLSNLGKNASDPLSALIKSYLSSANGTGAVTNPSDQNKPGANNSFAGLYRMVRPKAININSSIPQSGIYVEHIVFFNNGRVYRSLPAEGLLYFNYDDACQMFPNNCGFFELKNDRIEVFLGSASKKYIFTRSGDKINNPPELGKGTFRAIPACDGLVLDGNYRRHESEPAISFTKDGKFTEGGIFQYFGTFNKSDGSVYKDDGVGGSGNYLIRQNTLELKYTDGRVKRFVFEAFPENLVKQPSVESFLLVGQRLERY